MQISTHTVTAFRSFWRERERDGERDREREKRREERRGGMILRDDQVFRGTIVVELCLSLLIWNPNT